MRSELPGLATLNLFNRNVVLVPYLCFLLELGLYLSVSVEHKCKGMSGREPELEGTRGESGGWEITEAGVLERYGEK